MSAAKGGVSEQPLTASRLPSGQLSGEHLQSQDAAGMEAHTDSSNADPFAEILATFEPSSTTRRSTPSPSLDDTGGTHFAPSTLPPIVQKGAKLTKGGGVGGVGGGSGGCGNTAPGFPARSVRLVDMETNVRPADIPSIVGGSGAITASTNRISAPLPTGAVVTSSAEVKRQLQAMQKREAALAQANQSTTATATASASTTAPATAPATTASTASTADSVANINTGSSGGTSGIQPLAQSESPPLGMGPGTGSSPVAPSSAATKSNLRRRQSMPTPAVLPVAQQPAGTGTGTGTGTGAAASLVDRIAPVSVPVTAATATAPGSTAPSSPSLQGRSIVKGRFHISDVVGISDVEMAEAVATAAAAAGGAGAGAVTVTVSASGNGSELVVTKGRVPSPKADVAAAVLQKREKEKGRHSPVPIVSARHSRRSLSDLSGVVIVNVRRGVSTSLVASPPHSPLNKAKTGNTEGARRGGSPSEQQKAAVVHTNRATVPLLPTEKIVDRYRVVDLGPVGKDDATVGAVTAAAAAAAAGAGAGAGAGVGSAAPAPDAAAAAAAPQEASVDRVTEVRKRFEVTHLSEVGLDATAGMAGSTGILGSTVLAVEEAAADKGGGKRPRERASPASVQDRKDVEKEKTRRELSRERRAVIAVEKVETSEAETTDEDRVKTPLVITDNASDSGSTSAAAAYSPVNTSGRKSPLRLASGVAATAKANRLFPIAGGVGASASASASASVDSNPAASTGRSSPSSQLSRMLMEADPLQIMNALQQKIKRLMENNAKLRDTNKDLWAKNSKLMMRIEELEETLACKAREEEEEANRFKAISLKSRKKKDKERERDDRDGRDKERQREKRREREKDRDKDKDHERDRETPKDRDREEKEKEKTRDRDKNREEDTARTEREREKSAPAPVLAWNVVGTGTETVDAAASRMDPGAAAPLPALPSRSRSPTDEVT